MDIKQREFYCLVSASLSPPNALAYGIIAYFILSSSNFHVIPSSFGNRGLEFFKANHVVVLSPPRRVRNSLNWTGKICFSSVSFPPLTSLEIILVGCLMGLALSDVTFSTSLNMNIKRISFQQFKVQSSKLPKKKKDNLTLKAILPTISSFLQETYHSLI